MAKHTYKMARWERNLTLFVLVVAVMAFSYIGYMWNQIFALSDFFTLIGIASVVSFMVVFGPRVIHDLRSIPNGKHRTKRSVS